MAARKTKADLPLDGAASLPQSETELHGSTGVETRLR